VTKEEQVWEGTKNKSESGEGGGADNSRGPWAKDRAKLSTKGTSTQKRQDGRKGRWGAREETRSHTEGRK